MTFKLVALDPAYAYACLADVRDLRVRAGMGYTAPPEVVEKLCEALLDAVDTIYMYTKNDLYYPSNLDQVEGFVDSAYASLKDALTLAEEKTENWVSPEDHEEKVKEAFDEGREDYENEHECDHEDCYSWDHVCEEVRERLSELRAEEQAKAQEGLEEHLKPLQEEIRTLRKLHGNFTPNMFAVALVATNQTLADDLEHWKGMYHKCNRERDQAREMLKQVLGTSAKESA